MFADDGSRESIKNSPGYAPDATLKVLGAGENPQFSQFLCEFNEIVAANVNDAWCHAPFTYRLFTNMGQQ